MVPAYDDELVWEGHSSMVHEIARQLGGKKPGVLFCSIGGAGLLGGIIKGCEDVGWDDGEHTLQLYFAILTPRPVPIVALETIGSNCFHYSVVANKSGSSAFREELPEGTQAIIDEESGTKIIQFNKFSSRASGSLGASKPSARVVQMALNRAGGVKCVSVPDEMSMAAGVKFAGMFTLPKNGRAY